MKAVYRKCPECGKKVEIVVRSLRSRPVYTFLDKVVGPEVWLKHRIHPCDLTLVAGPFKFKLQASNQSSSRKQEVGLKVASDPQVRSTYQQRADDKSPAQTSPDRSGSA